MSECLTLILETEQCEPVKETINLFRSVVQIACWITAWKHFLLIYTSEFTRGVFIGTQGSSITSINPESLANVRILS